jgi:hypothetical protein
MPNIKRGMMASAGAGAAESGVWTQVGSIDTSPSPVDLAALTSSTAAFVTSPYYLRTYSFNDSTGDWSQTGNSLTVMSADNIRIVALTSTRIAWVDSNGTELRAYDWDGSSWTLTGSGLSGQSGIMGIARLSSTRVAVVKYAALTAYDFNGSSWSSVGNTLTISPSLGNPAACGLSSTRIVVMATSDQLRAYDFDGSNWTQTGNETTITPCSYADVARLSEDTCAVYYATGFSAQSYITK